MGEINPAIRTPRLVPALWGVVCGGAVGLFVALGIVIRNPVFFDHLGWTVLAVWLIPSVIGLLAGLVYSLARWPAGSADVSSSDSRILAGFSVFFLVICLGLWSWSRGNANHRLGPSWPKLIIVGLDGATWDVIDPMMAEGDLPHLAHLCKTGAHGPLKSLSPIWSPRIWTSLATGREPEDHGITGYYKTRSDLKSARLWDIAHIYGERVGLFRWLITWPPDRQFEFVIPSWLARSPVTWPSEYQFIQELDLNQDPNGKPPHLLGLLHAGLLHGFRIETAIHLVSKFATEPTDTDGSFINRHMRSVEPSVDVYLHLLRKFHPQVTSICLYGTDQLGHRFWKYFAPEGFNNVDPRLSRLYGNVIPNYYRLADRALGRVLAALPEQTTVMVVSDHGMGPDLASPARYIFRIDRILKQAGMEGLFTVTFAQRRYILRPTSRLTPGQLESFGNVLRAVHLCEDSEPIFKVLSEEDGAIILDPQMGMMVDPESPLQKTRGAIINGKVLKRKDLLEIRDLSGSHRLNGILIIKGPAILPGRRIADATVLDVAPTALRLLGLPVSREMPGRILDEALRQDFLRDHPLQKVDAFPSPPVIQEKESSDNALNERLRSLGYVK